MDTRRGETAQGSFPLALPGLTSVRFALAVGVVLFHYHLASAYTPVISTGLFERGRLGVDAFFILSGFILTHAYDRELVEGRFNYRRFVIARVARIFPLHFAVLAFLAMLVGGAALVGAEFDRSGYTLPGLIRSALLIQSWGSAPFPTGWNWNGPSWSLSAEWFAYLTFPMFAFIGLRWRRRPALLLALAGSLFFALDAVYREFFGAPLPHAEENFGILRLAPEFLYGVALYRLGQQMTVGRSVALACAAGSSVLVLSLMHVSADDRLIVVAFGPLMLSLALLSKASAEGWLAARPLAFLGEASFALYLVHMPILILWKNGVAELAGWPSTYSMGLMEQAVLFVLTLLAACIAYVVVERPARDLVRAWGERALAVGRPARSPSS